MLSNLSSCSFLNREYNAFLCVLFMLFVHVINVNNLLTIIMSLIFNSV